MISERSCDTENWKVISNWNKVVSKFYISHYYGFYCIFDQINTALVRIRDYFQKKKSYRPINQIPLIWTQDDKKEKGEGWNVTELRIRYLQSALCVCKEKISKGKSANSTTGNKKTKKTKTKHPPSTTAMKTNPIICVSCCKFVLMDGIGK